MQCADLLYGSGSKGVFQYDTKITLNMKSADGLVRMRAALLSLLVLPDLCRVHHVRHHRLCRAARPKHSRKATT